MRLKSELIFMYSTHDFHLKSINKKNKKLIVKDELKNVWIQEFALLKCKLIFSLSITSIVLVRVQKVIPRIKEIKKLISNLFARNFLWRKTDR